jgi:hypothetical protein
MGRRRRHQHRWQGGNAVDVSADCDTVLPAVAEASEPTVSVRPLRTLVRPGEEVIA